MRRSSCEAPPASLAQAARAWHSKLCVYAAAGCRLPTGTPWPCRPQPPGAASMARVEIMNAGTRGYYYDDKCLAPQSYLRVFVNTASGTGEGAGRLRGATCAAPPAGPAAASPRPCRPPSAERRAADLQRDCGAEAAGETPSVRGHQSCH